MDATVLALRSFRLLVSCAVAWLTVQSACRALAQAPADWDSVQRRLGELEWRAQQSDALAMEVERLRARLAAVDAQLRQYQQQPMTVVPVSALEPQRINPAQNIVAAGTPAASYQPEPEELPPPAAPGGEANHGAGGGYGYGYADGFQFSFWGWLSYTAAPQDRYDSFWAWEAQLGITKSFTDRLAASADISFIDTNASAFVVVDQLFLSVLFPECDDAIFTAGKFYTPFGIEPQQFWFRETGETTLVFRALPHEMVGLMYTQPLPIADTVLTFRPFIVNGIDENLDNNQQPSLGLYLDYRPCKCLSLGWTNWWGPEFTNDNDDKLFFTLAQTCWHITPKLSLEAEYLYGETETRRGVRLDWTGYALIVSQTLSERWRLFGQVSDLNDADGRFNVVPQRGEQAGMGFSFYLDKHVESRFEYVHEEREIANKSADRLSDEFVANLTFGY
jgi:hypothetical protein